MSVSIPIAVEFFGNKGCFSVPMSVADPVTYPCPPPSVVKGMLRSIGCKPGFDFLIHEIRMINEPRYHDDGRLERKDFKTNPAKVRAADLRTQRAYQVVLDPHFVVLAELIPNPDYWYTVPAYIRINQYRKCYLPGNEYMAKMGSVFMGIGDFPAHYINHTWETAPKANPGINIDIGTMCLDVIPVFDPEASKKARVAKERFEPVPVPNCQVVNGVLKMGVGTGIDLRELEIQSIRRKAAWGRIRNPDKKGK